MSREVTVYSEQSVYRARVEPAKSTIRRRDGWRYIIERCWSQIPWTLMRPEHWGTHKRGPWVPHRSDAATAAEQWLDNAEARNPSDGDYVGGETP